MNYTHSEMSAMQLRSQRATLVEAIICKLNHLTYISGTNLINKTKLLFTYMGAVTKINSSVDLLV